ncbi:hypothetical protein MPL1_10978 [Methylophaga lonarensis MPL]|uniref:HDOD domain-containing protein n=1 Tax=Methylophaga lonarensis MPL TaxID=1286106 RepID=M7NYM7_9GAMM|nr:HDOD domain-containing protein [Methylophaga lonarensis]EMR12296.1 hypothetical protein MPL1_10978 [Methylophaga lonarensis MPL]
MTLSATSLVNRSLELVSPPSTYTRLDTLIQDPDSAIDDFASVINTDPALATRLLKIVNSPFYGFPSQINTISRAITIIGTRELNHLVLATSVMNAFSGIPSTLINMDSFWQHSLACAMTARQLANACGQRGTERLFTAGLLHNIGSLVMYQSLPELAREAISSARFGNETIFQAEQRIIGFDHSEVGEALALAWRLPESLVDTIRHHHYPAEAKTAALDVAIVHVADVMVSAVPFGHAGDAHVPPLDPNAWQLLGLDLNIVPQILTQISLQLDSLTATMLKT